VTKTQRLGCFSLISGSLILLSVALLWLLVPMMAPQPSDTHFLAENSDDYAMAPALSPFTPPTATPGGTENESPLAIAELETVARSDSPAHDLAPSDWRIVDYPDADARIPRGQTALEESLRLRIPALELDAPVVTVGLAPPRNASRRQHLQWSVPDTYAAGWHETSAPPGEPGNTVLNGHNNIHGAVFGNLVDLPPGAEIVLYEDDRSYVYEVTHREFLREEGESLRTRIRNARWIAPSDDTRLTIVTCWPNTSNSHRLVVIAQPVIDDTS
jgi:sortase A